MALVVGGTGNALGERVAVDRAEENVFGVVFMNDWSARDVQGPEMVPLGPFNGKNVRANSEGWEQELMPRSSLRRRLALGSSRLMRSSRSRLLCLRGCVAFGGGEPKLTFCSRSRSRPTGLRSWYILSRRIGSQRTMSSSRLLLLVRSLVDVCERS